MKFSPSELLQLILIWSAVFFLTRCSTGYKIVNSQGECLYWVDYDKYGKKEILPCPSRHDRDIK